MKGIILAGGNGTRLLPMTATFSKQLLPICDKPMIFYPLTTLMLAGIRDILVITKVGELSKFRDLLGDGSQWGIRLSYASQRSPRGIAEALIIGDDFGFLQVEPVMLILGDNLFYADGLSKKLQSVVSEFETNKWRGAHVFVQRVQNPSEYGVLILNERGAAKDLVEKPVTWISDLAVTGLYVYDQQAATIARTMKPSGRGELEITDLNRAYINLLDSELSSLSYDVLRRGTAWFDTGTPEAMLEAANFVSIVQSRQDMLIGSPEEVALRMGFIDEVKFAHLVSAYPHGSSYRARLQRVIAKEIL
jgi:glucose-1-phosphate thymidylyltransferase